MDGSNFNQLKVFQAIVQEGSITGAARVLEMASPSVSQALKVLEKQLGLPLFTRTTRKIELTEAGHLLYQRTQSSMQALDIAFETVSELSKEPRGKVRLTAPKFVFTSFLQPIYAEFCQRFPDIELEISLFDGTVDILEQGFDLGIRFGDRISEGMVAKQLIPSKKDVLFASQEYIKQYGIPTSLNDLERHKLIYYRFITSNQLLPLTLQEGGEQVTVDVTPALIANDTDVVKDAAKQGLGIGRLLSTMVEDEIERGELIPILEDYWLDVAGLYLYFHQNAQKAKRVRTLIDFLIEKSK